MPHVVEYVFDVTIAEARRLVGDLAPVIEADDLSIWMLADNVALSVRFDASGRAVEALRIVRAVVESNTPVVNGKVLWS